MPEFTHDLWTTVEAINCFGDHNFSPIHYTGHLHDNLSLRTLHSAAEYFTCLLREGRSPAWQSSAVGAFQ